MCRNVPPSVLAPVEDAARDGIERFGAGCLIRDRGRILLLRRKHGGFVLFVFATSEFTGELADVEPDEHLEVRWHPASDVMLSPMFPTSKAAVEAHLAGGRAFSTHGFDAASGRRELVQT
ncbi:hypothetical protein ACFXPX_01395 [Kitasatospora sp. NPDC059146]|uniref:hypothetical protein n=1 Tax=unclassified Kitasatospora TaxID=2633591 RepID=UPI0036A2DD7A